jgi:hypothetical protein
MLTDSGSCFWLHWGTCHSCFYWVLQVVDAIISHGCFLRECSIDHSIVGERSRLDYGVELKVNYCDFWILSSSTKEPNWLEHFVSVFSDDLFEWLFLFSGHRDDGSRLLPNWIWNCISLGRREGPNWGRTEYKN